MSDDLQALAETLRVVKERLGADAARALFEQQASGLTPAQRDRLGVLVFGSGTQMGDVSVGDVAGGDVHKGTQGTTEVSGTVYGAAVGVNLGSIHVSHGSPAPSGGPALPAAAEQIAAQRERLAAHRATLDHYLGQLAIVGSANARPEVSAGIREARASIRRVKETLRRWGVAVEDGPDDEPLAAR